MLSLDKHTELRVMTNTDRPNRMATIGRWAEVLLGIVFFVGMVLKAYDANLFVRQILQYGVIESRLWLEYAALGTLAVEGALSVALITGLRLRGLTYALTLAVLLVFTGLIAYGWIFHNLDDCGCFGNVKMSPEASILKNGILALLAVVAWVGEFYRTSLPVRWKSVSIKMLATIILTAGFVGYAYWDLRQIASTTQPPSNTTDAARPFAQFVFENNGETIDLGEGEYVVALMNATCEHCMASVAELNELMHLPETPTVIGICMEDREGDLDTFLDVTGPEFPIFSMGNDIRTFYRLIGNAPPRIAYIRDGSFVSFWDEHVPTRAELAAALAQDTNGIAETAR